MNAFIRQKRQRG